MRVLLTGATGLVGQRVLHRLLGRGDAVTALAVPQTVRELAPHPRLTVVAGTLSEPARLGVAARGCDVVIHAAAELPGSRPADIERVNVEGTENLLLAIAEARVRRFVLLSSTAVYADAPARDWPIAEAYPLRPTHPPAIAYGLSKIAAEAHVTRFRRRHRLECAILRAPTVYGPGAALPERLIGDLLARPVAALRSPLAGVPMQWVHVDDLAAATIGAAVRPGVEWALCNVAGPDLFDLPALRRLALELSGAGRPWRRGALHSPDLPGLPLRYDIGRAERLLGWRPATTLRAGVGAMLARR